MSNSVGWSSVPNWVIRSDKLHGTEKWVYITLLNRANEKGECWPSLSTLQKEVGVSKNTILKALRSLELKGLIDRIQRRSGGVEYASNLYRIHAWEGGSETELGGSNESQGVVQQLNQGGSNESQEVLPTEVLPNRSTTHIAFDAVWKLWPKKTEKDRAKREFLKNVEKVPNLPELIGQFAAAYEATTEKRYIPSLAAWLHRKRWTDELPTESRKVSVVERNLAAYVEAYGGGSERAGSVPALNAGIGT